MIKISNTPKIEFYIKHFKNIILGLGQFSFLYFCSKKFFFKLLVDDLFLLFI